MKFPPGCPRLWTYPEPTGSPAAAMTMGMVEVACCSAGQRGARNDHVHLQPDQLGGQAGEARGIARAPARLGREMLAVHVTELTQAAQERAGGRVPWLGPGRVRDLEIAEDPDAVDLARGLGTGGAGRRQGPEGKACQPRRGGQSLGHLARPRQRRSRSGLTTRRMCRIGQGVQAGEVEPRTIWSAHNLIGTCSGSGRRTAWAK